MRLNQVLLQSFRNFSNVHTLRQRTLGEFDGIHEKAKDRTRGKNKFAGRALNGWPRKGSICV